MANGATLNEETLYLTFNVDYFNYTWFVVGVSLVCSENNYLLCCLL